jgi:4'-phosphopantetheinyl transferase
MEGSGEATLPLGADEVDVWLFDLDRRPERFAQPARALSPQEWEQARRFCFERDRRRFVARRAVRRALLAGYTALDPARLRFAPGPQGRPELASGDVRFSSSHAYGLGLLAVARGRRVGADIERIRPVAHAEEIARDVFEREDAAALEALAPGARLESFFVCWTEREAYVKATGDGLGQAGHGRAAAGEWSLRRLRPAAGWVAAVAVEGRGPRLTCRWW